MEENVVIKRKTKKMPQRCGTCKNKSNVRGGGECSKDGAVIKKVWETVCDEHEMTEYFF